MAHCFLQFLSLDLVQYDWVPVNRSFEKQLLLKTLEDKMQEAKESRVRFAAREWRGREGMGKLEKCSWILTSM